MLVRLGPNWVFVLVILAGLGTLVGSQRRVVVHTAQDRDLRLTAHRLGVPVDRVEKGRHALRLATDLVASVAGSESVAELGRLWISLDRRNAAAEIEGLMQLLRETASETEEPRVFNRATNDGRALSAALLSLDVDEAGRIMEDWPQAPGETRQADDSESESWRRNQHLTLRKLAKQDVNAALKLLSILEDSGTDSPLRMSLLYGLTSAHQSASATQLFNETLARVSALEPEKAASSLRSLVRYSADYMPGRLPETLQTWTQVVREVPQEDLSHGPTLEGLDLDPLEAHVAHVLTDLNQVPLEKLNQVLAQFPGLQQKLREFGGIRGFRHAVRQEQARRAGQTSPDRKPVTNESIESALKALTTTPETMKKLYGLILDVQGYYEEQGYDPDYGERLFLRIAQLIEQLDDPLAKVRAFPTLVRIYMTLEGQLSDQLLQQGWDLLVEIDRKIEERADSDLYVAAAGQFLDPLEVWLYAAWIWNDHPVAMKEIGPLREELQFNVLVKVAGWFSGGGGFSNRQSFR